MNTRSRRKRIVGLFLFAIGTIALLLPVKAVAPGQLESTTITNLVNGSFEDPIKYTNNGAGYAFIPETDITGWNTTATDHKIEYGWLRADGTAPHMQTNFSPTVKLPSGQQFIELAAADFSALYQYVDVSAEGRLLWSLSHRARSATNNLANDIDVMAILMGPKQPYEATRTSTNAAQSYDQFGKITKWAVEQGLWNTGVEKNSLSDTITVYAPPFAEANGTFQGSEEFSLTPTEVCTEKWDIRFIKSDAQQWYKYTGEYSADPAMGEITFAISPYSSALAAAKRTCGNLVDAVSVTNASNAELLRNGSYEYPLVANNTGSGNFTITMSREDPNAMGWHCASDSMEMGYLGATGTPYFKSTVIQRVVNVPDGNQYAELNANEPSTLFQYIYTEEGKVYEWGLNHRGRSGIDTMALIIGPRQDYDPVKPSREGQDQLMRITEWLKQQVDVDIGLDIYNFSESGCSKKIILYSAPFGPDGSFVDETNPFSWTKDETHTEQWNVWIMSSSCERWHDYGDCDQNANYDYTYKIPTRADGNYESIFSFVSFNSATPGAANLSYGNLLDVIRFQEYYQVECYTTPSGDGTYIYTDEHEFHYYQNYIGYIPADQTFQVIAREKEGAENRAFIGARINGVFYPVDAGGWTESSPGVYVYTSPAVQRHYEVRLIFAAQEVIYDVNGGDPYHYDPTDPTTGYEVTLSRENRSYTSHEATKADNPGWRFEGWRYANNSVMYDKVHEVHYDPYMENGELSSDITKDTISIWQMENGILTEKVSQIPESMGVTLIAQWTYRQAVIPQTFQHSTNTYEVSDIGGTVAIKGTYTETAQDGVTQVTKDLAAEGAYAQYGEYLFAENQSEMVAVATPKEGCRFIGWYDAYGRLISTNAEYAYTITDRNVNELYARFDVLGYNLSIEKTVTGNMGSKDRYFAVTVTVENAKPSTVYTFSGYDSGNVVTIENQTVTNPRVLETDSSGRGQETFYIMDGQQISLNRLPEGTRVTVAEKDYSKKGYVTTYPNGNQVTVSHTMPTIQIVNEKNTLVPAGAHTNLLQMAGITGAALLMILFYIRRKRNI